MSLQLVGLDMCKVTIATFVHFFSVFLCRTTFITFISRRRRFHSGVKALTDSVCSQIVGVLCWENFFFPQTMNHDILVHMILFWWEESESGLVLNLVYNILENRCYPIYCNAQCYRCQIRVALNRTSSDQS